MTETPAALPGLAVRRSYLLASGTNVAPGFRLASSQPETIIQSGNDRGNFLGTAVWTNGEETTLTAELEAGWYRYISQWTFHTNGTIKPLRLRRRPEQLRPRTCTTTMPTRAWTSTSAAPGAISCERSTAAGWSVVPKESVAFRDMQLKARWRWEIATPASAMRSAPVPTTARPGDPATGPSPW